MPERTWDIYTFPGGDWVETFPVKSSSWGRTLNEVGDQNTTVLPLDSDELNRIKSGIRSLIRPWTHVLVTKRNGAVIGADLLTGWDYQFGTKELTLHHSQFRVYLEKVTTFGTNGYSGADLGHNSLKLVNYNLPAACQAVVYVAQLKPGGNTLPVDFELSFPDGYPGAGDPQGSSGTLSREIFDYNVQYIEDVITELQEMPGGPDVDFEPYLTSAGKLRWRMRTNLTPANVFDFDLDGTEPGLVLGTLSMDAQGVANTRYAIGSGSEADMRVGTAKATTTVPVLEGDDEYKTLTEQADLDSHASADLATFSKPAYTLDASIQLSSLDKRQIAIADLRLGSTIRVKQSDDPFIGASFVSARLIEIRGNESETVTMILDWPGDS